MSKFTSTTATLKHNGGLSKDYLDQGFERLDSEADRKAFVWSRQCPEMQGWRNPPPEASEMEMDYED